MCQNPRLAPYRISLFIFRRQRSSVVNWQVPATGSCRAAAQNVARRRDATCRNCIASSSVIGDDAIGGTFALTRREPQISAGGRKHDGRSS